MGAIRRASGFVDRTIFYRPTIDVEMKCLRFPVNLSHCPRGNQNLFTRQPVFGVDNNVADGPVVILHQEVVDMSDTTVNSMYVITRDNCNATKIRIPNGYPLSDDAFHSIQNISLRNRLAEKGFQRGAVPRH